MNALAERYPDQKGILGGTAETITNMTAVLVVVGIVMGLAYGLYKWAFATSEWQALDGLVSAVRRIYQGEPYPASGIGSQLISSQAAGSLRISGSTILNTYGTAYGFAGSSGSFNITDAGVPAADCISILKQIPSTGYLSVAINGGTAITAFPITAASATTSCSVSTSTGNSIVVTAQ